MFNGRKIGVIPLHEVPRGNFKCNIDLRGLKKADVCTLSVASFRRDKRLSFFG